MNIPAFNAAAERLREAGHDVFNPAEHEQEGGDFASYMAVDLAQVCKSEAVAVLEGWEDSQGARMEVNLAYELGLPVLHYNEQNDTLEGAYDRRYLHWQIHPQDVAKGEALHEIQKASLPTTLPTDAAARKTVPLWRGTFGYFPDALAEVARLCYVANEQHNPGEPMHWARGKSMDQEDCLLRHLLHAEQVDTDGFLHAVKVAWRGLAIAQLAIEKHNKEAL